ncbi:MAG: hypothetical protein STSR0009_29150 [Methanoregula sp.]
MTTEYLPAIRLLSTPGQCLEVRAITEDGIASGYFDSPEELAATVETLDGLPTVHGIYVTINPVNPALFSRRANRIKMRLGKKDAATADADIERRHWLPIDIDPVRPSGVSSTDAEHETAIATARRVAAFLTEKGFPAPILADSGNGAHLLYRIDQPNDDASRLIVKRCLDVLDTLFSDDKATVDTANFNAARIWKLYGTMSRKGDTTKDRPHRRSKILDAPQVSEIVGQEMLEQLTTALPNASVMTDAHNQSAGHPIVLSQWLANHGLTVRYEKPYEGGTLYQLEECPFSAAHKHGAYAIQFPNGACYAGCHHTTCGNGKQRWQELRERYEPSKEKAIPPAQKKAIPPRAPPGIPPVPAMAELPGKEEALAILRNGNPKLEMLRTFALDHEGDETVAECLILSLASRSIINTKGLHVSITGESGKGKSHAFDMMIKQLPERFQLCGSMSNKALFYIEDLLPGTAIVFDDTNLSEDMAAILKGVTTSFQKPFKHRTVTKDRKGMICTIPERCIWWVAKVEGIGDDQVFNRMLTCWIDDSANQDDRVLLRTLGACETVPAYGNDERPDVLVCRTMWEIIGSQQYYVVIPFATQIQFQAHRNRRNPEMLLDMIKANAILRAFQRESREINGFACIIAVQEDFDSAVRLYTLLNGSAGGQDTKLTKKESDLVDAIIQMHQDEFTIPQLQKKTGLANCIVHKLLHGYASRGATYSGLLEKCPAIAYTDRTVVVDDEFCNGSTRRRTNAYTFDPEIFATWGGSAGVWIKETRDITGGNTHCSALLQPFCNPAANAEQIEMPNSVQDSANNPYNTHLDLSNNLYCCISKITQQPVSADVCARDPGVAAHIDPNRAERPQNNETEPKTPHNSVLHMQNTCSRMQQDRNSHSEELITVGVKIHATDYKRLDCPEPHVPCFSCGKNGSWYVEKLTSERKARLTDQQAARRVCRKCYDAAVCRDRAASPPLPGVIDLVGMERHAPNIGKCSVCNLGAATYLAESSGVKLCETCHSREVQRQCRPTEVPI